MAAPKDGMTLTEFARREKTTVSAVNMLIGSALKKLHRNGSILTAAELARGLESHRNDAHTVRGLRWR